MELPFTITPDAERWLMQFPDYGPGNVQPGISQCYGYRREQDGKLLEELNEIHYTVGYNSAEDWMTTHKAAQFYIGTMRFWISASTLETIRGKQLILQKKVIGRGPNDGKTAEFLFCSQPNGASNLREPGRLPR